MFHFETCLWLSVEIKFSQLRFQFSKEWDSFFIDRNLRVFEFKFSSKVFLLDFLCNISFEFVQFSVASAELETLKVNEMRKTQADQEYYQQKNPVLSQVADVRTGVG